MQARLRARWPHFSYIGNPIDPWGVDEDYESLYAEVLAAAADEDVDVVAVALDKVTPWAGKNERDLSVAAGRALVEATVPTAKVPVFFTVHATAVAADPIRQFLRGARVPLLHGVRQSLVALRCACWWQSWRPRRPPVETSEAIPLSFAEPGPILSERASREVLRAYGIPLVSAEASPTAGDAVTAAERLGFPVVLKADVPGVGHKSARGLVVTGVSSPAAVGAAFERLMDAARTGGVSPRGVLTEETASGVEIICGMRRDAVFGPVVLLGVGGALAEVLGEVSVRVCPVAPEDVAEMLDESPAGRLLSAAGAAIRPVVEEVGALARLALEHPEIAEVDVNPLFAGPSGAVAADALVVLSA